MELEQITERNLNNINQNEFLDSALWKSINGGIDIGLRYLLPDLVEDEVIDLKDNLINYGLKDGIKKSVESVVETGKQALGIITGDFENVGQIQKVLKNGGLIDKVSDLLDFSIDKVQESGKINSSISGVLKKGKTSILSNIEKNIEATLNSQISNAQNMEKYISNWKEYYNSKDFSGMQKEYNKIINSLKELIPIENTIKQARYIENMHNLIKNNGQNFKLTEEQIELAKKLLY